MNLNVVIDASGMFYRSLFTVGNFGGAKGEKLLDNAKSQGIFIRKLATDFSSTVRDTDNPSRVVICLDSSSWRKKIEIEDGKYKDGREEKKQDSPINWKNFYELTDKFAEILSRKGYLISRIPGAEADDLLYLWSRKLNNDGENVILVTGDRDLLQTVQHCPNGTWTISLDPVNKRKKISLTQQTYENKGTVTESAADIFSPDTWASSDDVLDKLLGGYELNIIDTAKFTATKVILGDGGDAVPGIVNWPDKKEPEKTRSMTESNYQKMLVAIPELVDITWQELNEGKFANEISKFMADLRTIEVDPERVKSNMSRNCTLMVLDDSIIPQDIQDSFIAAHKDSPVSIALVGRDSILNGTEWLSTDKTAYVPKSYDLFGDL